MRKENATSEGRQETRQRVEQLRAYEKSHPEQKHYNLQDLEKRMLAGEIVEIALRKMSQALKDNDSKGIARAKQTSEKMQREIRSIDAKYL